MISEENGQYLLEVAKEAISVYLETNRRISIPQDCPDELKEDLGVFVTLNKNISNKRMHRISGTCKKPYRINN